MIWCLWASNSLSHRANFVSHRGKQLLWPLSRTILWSFSSNLPGNFVLKNGGDFWWIFSGLRLPQNEARKLLKNIGENSGKNSGQNSGRKIEKFGKLSFCNFSDLRNSLKQGFAPCKTLFWDSCPGWRRKTCSLPTNQEVRNLLLLVGFCRNSSH